MGSRLSPVGSPLLWAGLRKGTGLHRLLAHQQSEVGVSLYLEVLCGTFTLTGGHESWWLFLHGCPKSKAVWQCRSLAAKFPWLQQLYIPCLLPHLIWLHKISAYILRLGTWKTTWRTPRPTTAFQISINSAEMEGEEVKPRMAPCQHSLPAVAGFGPRPGVSKSVVPLWYSIFCLKPCNPQEFLELDCSCNVNWSWNLLVLWNPEFLSYRCEILNSNSTAICWCSHVPVPARPTDVSWSPSKHCLPMSCQWPSSKLRIAARPCFSLAKHVGHLKSEWQGMPCRSLA